MKKTASINQWHVVGDSVLGASHIRDGLPNQDAIRWEPKVFPNDYAILAVSDGHGSHKSFRSDKGSKIAIDVAVSVLLEYRNFGGAAKNLSMLKDAAEEKLPKEIVRQWKEGVDHDYKCLPFVQEELGRLERLGGANARKTVEDDPFIAYGATLIAILVTESFLFFLQIGDGDILTVAESGQVVRPLVGDERLFANETTSLCSPDAWRDFRSRVHPMPDVPPALMLASTDGYSNSFSSEAGFLKVGTDLLKIAKREGIETVENGLKTWLDEASHKGSGDDITVGIIFRSTFLDQEDRFGRQETVPIEELNASAGISETTSGKRELPPTFPESSSSQPSFRPQHRAEVASDSPHRQNRIEVDMRSLPDQQQPHAITEQSSNKAITSGKKWLIWGLTVFMIVAAVVTLILFYLNSGFRLDSEPTSPQRADIQEVTIQFSIVDKNVGKDLREWIEEAKRNGLLQCNEKDHQIKCHPGFEGGQLRMNIVEKLKSLTKSDQSQKKDSQANVEITIKEK